MSEEQNTQNTNVEKPCNGKKIIVLLTILSLFFSIAALTTSIVALNGGAGANKKVVISKQYDKGQSLEKAQATGKPIIAFFYADWCGFCQKFAPVFNKIAKSRKIKQNFAIAYVNCEKPENQSHAQSFGISGFPTVYVIDAQGNKTQLDNGTFFNEDSKEVVAKKALEIIGIKED